MTTQWLVTVGLASTLGNENVANLDTLPDSVKIALAAYLLDQAGVNLDFKPPARYISVGDVLLDKYVTALHTEEDPGED